MRRTVNQLTIGCDNRERHITRSRNAANSLHIGPAEDGDRLATLICWGQAVQIATDCSILRNVCSSLSDSASHACRSESPRTFTGAHFNIHLVLHQRLLRHGTVSHGIPRSTGIDCVCANVWRTAQHVYRTPYRRLCCPTVRILASFGAGVR